MGHTPGRRERKKQHTRQALEDAALGLFAERGFHATTVADIADTVDVSTRTFFRYFDTKDQVLFADHPRRVDSLIGALRASDNLTTTTLADAVVDFFAEDLARSAGRFRVQLQIAATHPPSRATLFQHQADLVDVVARELRRRKLARSLEAQMFASALLVAVREMSLPWLLEGHPDLQTQLHEARDRLCNLASIAAA